jgi:predicted Fe-Mo cluster-binding NifX family protein
VDHVVIHYEPLTKEYLMYAAPIGEDELVSPHFGEAPRFALLKVRAADRQVVEQQTMANPFPAEEHGRGMRVAEWLVRAGVDVVLAGEGLSAKAPGYVFGQARVRVVTVKSRGLAEALAAEGVVLTGQAPGT